MSSLGRAAALHVAFWQYDRWYRWAWFVWPPVLAMLLAAWLVGGHAPLSIGKWAKPVACTDPPNPACAATRRPVLQFSDEIINPTTARRGIVTIDRTAFATSAAADRPRLTAALAAYYRSEWQKGIDALKPADANDRNVQFVLALLNLGAETFDSVRNAQSLLRNAADAGQRQAGVLLGGTLMGWQGLPKDMAQGRRLIENGATGGDSYAMRLAAIGHLTGEFGARDAAKAFKLMQQAADAGDPVAMAHLGWFYYSGLGAVARDEGKSLDYLRRAAEGGVTGVQDMLGWWTWQRYLNEDTQDPSEAFKWYERAYRQGYSVAALGNLAFFYRWARAPWNNTSRSFSLLQLCARFAFSNCHFMLAAAYHIGSGTTIDLIKAYAGYTVAKQLGFEEASQWLQQLDAAMLPAAKAAAIELSGKISAGLRSIPAMIELQTAEAIAGPSPWEPPSVGEEAQSRTQTETAPDWAACKGENVDVAIQACTRLIVSGGLTGQELGLAHYHKGWRLFQKRQYEQAVSEFDEAIRLRAELTFSYNDRGAALQILGKLDAALRDFEDAIRTDPSYALAYANRGSIELIRNQPDKAIADATVAIRLNPRLPRAYWVRAGGYELKVQWSEVIADCTTALGINPKFDGCLDRRGFAYARTGRTDLALADYDESLRIAPQSIWTLTARGNLHKDKQMLDLAVADYSEAIRLKPNYAPAYANRADARFMQKQYEVAIADASKAIEFDSKSALAFTVRGRAKMQLGNLSGASSDLASAVQLSPNNARVRYWSADAEVKLEENLYKACPKREGRGGTAADRMMGGGGLAVCFTGPQYVTALTELTEAIRLDSQFDDAYAYRGHLYLLLQQRDRGIADLRKALQINMGNDYARNRLRSINAYP